MKLCILCGKKASTYEIDYKKCVRAEDTRTQEQKETLHRLLERLKGNYPEVRVMGHRDLYGVKKDCPCFDVKK